MCPGYRRRSLYPGTRPGLQIGSSFIAALVDNPGTRHQTLELVSGDGLVAAAFPDHNTGTTPTHRPH
jgi:hypothetical protein